MASANAGADTDKCVCNPAVCAVSLDLLPTHLEQLGGGAGKKRPGQVCFLLP